MEEMGLGGGPGTKRDAQWINASSSEGATSM